MKTTLKGNARYFPGCLYALLISAPVLIIIGILIKPGYKNLGTPGIVFIFVICVLIYIMFMSVGKRIFESTQKSYEKKGKTAEKAKKYAEITEAIVFFFGVVVIAFVVTILQQNIGF